MDLRRILHDECIPSTSPSPVPQFGLLTQTIVLSPVVKWIFPARIRHEDKNDVIIVRENYIELKQLVIGSRIRTVALKADFDATIRAARILGEPRKRVETPNESESDFVGDDGDPASDADTMDLDAEAVTLPPQMLALTLRSADSARLMFLFAQDDRAGLVRFLSSTVELPGDASSASLPDAHLAVDPKSRALAVAAQSDVLILYALKSRDEILHAAESQDGSNMESFNPIRPNSQITFDLSAAILKMEFLYPPKETALQSVVYLLVVLSTGGQTQMRLFEWDTAAPNRMVRDIWSEPGYPLPNYARALAPSQLIPITSYCGFILAFQDFMILYGSVNTAYAKPYRVDYPPEGIDYPPEEHRQEKLEALYEFGEFPRPRYWTAWARPARNQDWNDKNDCLYLGREDGLVSFINISSREGHTERHEIGKVDVSIDSGFASLDPGGPISHQYWDVLAITGNCGDGGMFDYRPRGWASPLPQKLHNWSPVLDWAAIPSAILPSTPTLHYPTNVDTGRMFACAGYGMRHGRLSEIRRGIEAHCVSEISLDSLGAGRPTQLWLLNSNATDDRSDHSRLPGVKFNHDTKTSELEISDNPRDHLTILISTPGSGSERFVVSGRGELDANSSDPVLDVLIDADAQTLAAAVTADEIALQITDRSVRAVSVCPSGKTAEVVVEEAPSRIAHACIEGRTSTCLVCLSGAKNEIHYIRVAHGERLPQISTIDIIRDIESDSGISCASLCSFTPSALAILGTADGGLVLYRADERGLVRDASYRFEGESAVCESVSCLQRRTGRSGSKETFLLCGLRNGSLQILRYQSSRASSLTLFRTFRIGQSTVWTFPEYTSHTRHSRNPSSATIVCRDMFFRLSIKSYETRRLSLHRIWPTQAGSTKINQGLILAVGQYQSWLGRRPFSKALCYVEDRALRVLNIDSSRIFTTVPSQIKLDGSPRRVIYAKSINKLVVAYEELVMVPARRNAHVRSLGGKQLMFSKVRIVDPDVNLGPDPVTDGQVVGLSGDRILSLREWTPKLNGNSWPLLVVSTHRKREHEGGIYIFRLRDSEDTSSLRLQKEIPRGDPVHSIIPFGDTCLAYACGRWLEVIELATSEKGFSWSQPSRLQIELDSPARALSTNGTEIFVSTALHSHLVCAIVADQLKVRCTDYKARRGLDNMQLSTAFPLLLGSDMEGGLCGLWEADDNHDKRNMRPVFEAHLLNPIIRLRRAGLTCPETTPGVRHGETIIGVSTNGSFHAFNVLEAPQWRLLRFVQNLIDRDRDICPATHMENTKRHIEPGTGPNHMHVNGDILARLFEQHPSGETCLQGLMEAPPSPKREANHGHAQLQVDFESEQLRVERFYELVRLAFPGVTGGNPYEQVMSYLETLLHPLQ